MSKTFKKFPFSIFLISLFFYGCSPQSSTSSDASTVEEIKSYTDDNTQPDPGIPYIDELPIETTPSANIPDNLLTIIQAKEVFKSMGFEDYQESTEDNLDVHTSTSNLGELILKENGPGLVSSVQLKTPAAESKDTLDPTEIILDFLNLATNGHISDDKKTLVTHCITSLQQDNSENSEVLEINSIMFSMQFERKTGQYIVVY